MFSVGKKLNLSASMLVCAYCLCIQSIFIEILNTYLYNLAYPPYSSLVYPLTTCVLDYSFCNWQTLLLWCTSELEHVRLGVSLTLLLIQGSCDFVAYLRCCWFKARVTLWRTYVAADSRLVWLCGVLTLLLIQGSCNFVAYLRCCWFKARVTLWRTYVAADSRLV